MVIGHDSVLGGAKGLQGRAVFEHAPALESKWKFRGDKPTEHNKIPSPFMFLPHFTTSLVLALRWSTQINKLVVGQRKRRRYSSKC